MPTITGSLTWDTTVSTNHGWLLQSDAIMDGTAVPPSPDSCATNEEASEEELIALVEATLRWEGYKEAPIRTFEASADSYAYDWSAEVSK